MSVSVTREAVGGVRSRNATVGVLAVDDQECFRRVVCDVVQGTPGFEVVGETDTGEGAVSLVAMLRPQLVLMDVCMPGIGGVEAARRIAEVARERVAVVLMSADPRLLSQSTMAPGAVGVLRKERLSPAALRALWDRANTGASDLPLKGSVA